MKVEEKTLESKTVFEGKIIFLEALHLEFFAAEAPVKLQ